ncbi:MAG: MATE family efflux transporter [Saprospiraceae bacterium]
MHELIYNLRRLFVLSLPVMLGSAGQNLIALTDSMFLYHYDEHDFAAIGIVSVFYLIISSIAYGFSKGGQILIARKYGEKAIDVVKKYFYTLCVFEFLIGLLVFGALKIFPEKILGLFIHTDVILQKSLAFLNYRTYGLMFSYVGLGFFALYMGLAKSRIILINTVFLGLVNIILCFVLVFGKFGFKPMGIAGAGLASSIAEIAAFIFFIIYLVFDKHLSFLNLSKLPAFNIAHIKTIVAISTPILFQSIIGIASWFVFFVFIEKLGEEALSISNLLRVIYLVLTIPSWGFALSLNTIVSKTIGRKRSRRVIKQVAHGCILSAGVTGIIAFPFLCFPSVFLAPLLNNTNNEIYSNCVPFFPLLYLILLMASVSVIMFNGVSGTGETMKALNIQIICSVCYLTFCYYSITNPQSMGLYGAWWSEFIYWAVQGLLSWYILRTEKWALLKI